MQNWTPEAEKQNILQNNSSGNLNYLWFSRLLFFKKKKIFIDKYLEEAH